MQNTFDFSKHIKHCRARFRILEELWKNAFQKKSLPQFDKYLAHQFSLHKHFGKRDRKFYADVLFSCLRYAVPALQLCGFQTDSISLCVQHLAKVNFLDFLEFVLLLQNQRQYQCDMTSDFSSEKIKQFKQFSASWNPLHFFPAELHPFLQKRFEVSRWDSEQTDLFLNRITNKPPLWIRVRSADDMLFIKNELTEIQAGYHPLDEKLLSLCINSNTNLQKTKSYQSGKFEIQDIASQLIGAAIPCASDALIWDTCAGGGGKTVQIASQLNGQGAIYASDIRHFKLEEAQKRAQRGGFSNVKTLPWEGDVLPNFPHEIQKNKGFSTVFIDAPCTSLGTFRRNPDVVFRFSPQSLENVLKTQRYLLDLCSQAVAPGGTLVYATCSFLAEENEGQVAEFLDKNRDFYLEYQSLIGSPQRDGDTMFFAVMRHKNS